LDDCWAGGRYPNGTVYPQQSTFGSGIRALADYVHSRGLKFGLYTDRGTKTCAGRPGALGYEKIDADTYAAWTVDYLKEDSCYATSDHNQAFKQYGTMRDALNRTGRPIFFSLCGWEEWYAPVGYNLGNSWRIGPDDSTWKDVIDDVNIDLRVHKYSGPGGWNDPCLLLGENLPFEQAKTQFSLWCVMAAPLLISSNVRDMTDKYLQIYTNKELIAVSQDPWGDEGFRIYGSDLDITALHSVNVIARPLKGNSGSWAVLFVNVGQQTSDITCDAACLLNIGYYNNTTFKVRDLWLHKDEGTARGSYTASKIGTGQSKIVEFTKV